jgi:ParB family chromosome partitioning protein
MGRRYSYQPGRGGRLTAESLIRAFRQEADRQRLLVKKAELTRNRLLFIVSALRTLLADEHFVTLLRAERLDSMPRYLADRVQAVAPHAS